MNETQNKLRMVENEVVFRKHNESVLKGFDKLEKIAKEDGQESYVQLYDDPLNFYCECSDENCTERISIKPSKYAQIHTQRNRFTIFRGHQSKSIERIIVKEAKYWIVEKSVNVPKTATTLKKTDIDNTTSRTEK